MQTDWQGGAIKITKRLLITYLISFITLSGVGLGFLFNPFSVKQAEAAWFNDSWAYRKAFTFTHNASVGTPSKGKFDVDTTAAPDSFQADCGDVRFTDPSGTILKYYYDSAGGVCDNASTDFYVLMPTIINGSNLVYMYYGNPSVVDGTQAAQFSEATTSPSGGAPSAASEEKAPSPVAYWKFDEGVDNTCTGGTNDVCNSGSGGSGANGAQSNMSNGPTSGWQTEDQCISGKCLSFDSTDDIVAAGSPSSLDNLPAGGMTLEAWLYPRSNGENSAGFIMIKNDTNSQSSGWLFGLSTSLSLGFIADATGTDPLRVSATNVLTQNSWNHVVVTWDGVVTTASSIHFYVNGKETGYGTTTNGSGSRVDDSASTFNIGNEPSTTSRTFDGKIDEPKVYNYVRSASQIQADYNSRSNPEGLSVELGNNNRNIPGALSNGLVGYWKMDESSGTATDSSGNGLTLTNNATTTYVAGKYGSATNFVAASSQYLNTATTISSVKTVAFWANPSSNSDEYINLIASTAYITSSSGTVSATGFTNPSIYVNGVLNGTITASSWNHVLITTDTGINANAFEIGRGNGAYNNGKIDDTRLYNRALSTVEISQLYNWAPGPIGYWKMDEASWTNNCSTATVLDSSGNGKNGVSCPSGSGATATQAGKYSKAGNLDGSNDYLEVPTPSLPTGDFTYEAWVNLRSVNDETIYMASGSTSSSSNEILIYVDSSAKIRVDVDDSTSAVLTTGTVSANTWTHITLTRIQSTGKLTVYFNGVADPTTGTQSSTLDFTTCQLLIGADSDNGCNDGGNPANEFDGKLDDLRIYNYARTQGQIIEDMNGGHPAPGSPVSSAVAHWKLDEGFGTTASDSTPNRNDLTLSTATATWRPDGKFGKNFDATGATWMTRADDADFDFGATDSFAISMWFKSGGAGNPGGNRPLIKKGPTSEAGYALYYNSSGQLCFGIDDDTSWGPDIASCSTDDFVDTLWHHVVGIRDVTSDKTYIYVDGIQRDSDTDPTTATLANTGTLYLGDWDAVDNGDEVIGRIDEVKVYRSALTLDQVKLDFNHSQGQNIGSLGDKATANYYPNSDNQKYCVPGDSTTCTDPEGEWNFDEGSGSNAQDSASNGNTGSITGAVYSIGKINQSLDFDGTDDVVTVTNASQIDLNTASGFSYEAWIYADSAGEGSGGQIFNKGSTNFLRVDTLAGSNLDIEGQLTLGSANATLNVSTAITQGSWNHVAMTYTDDADDEITIYVNGVNKGSSTNGSGSISAESNNLLIGGPTTDNFDGKIDQFRFYGYERTPSQIAWDYNKGGPVAHWKLDECQGTIINDSSGNSLSGTLTIGGSGTNTAVGTCITSGAWFDGASGKRNYSLDLDGTDDYVSVPYNSKLDMTDGNLTLSAWIKRVGTNDHGGFISKTNNSTLWDYDFAFCGSNTCGAGSNEKL